MRPQRTSYLVVAFIVLESLFSYYVAVYTARERVSWEEYSAGGAVTALDSSYDAGFFVVGDASGRFSLVQRSGLRARWTYDGVGSVASLKMSASGDYIGWMDSEGRVGLFSLTPPAGVMVTPLWTRSLPGARLEGVYSSGGLPSLVYLVASQGDRLFVFGSDGEVAHEYVGLSDFVGSRLSYDGNVLVSVDSEGRVYLYDLTRSDPLWVEPTGLSGACLVISMDGSVLVVGGSEGNGEGGALCTIERGGNVSSRFSFDSAVRRVAVSSDGGRVFALLASDNVYMREGESEMRRISTGANEIISPAFSPYLATYGGGAVSFLYLQRPVPLWFTSVSSSAPLMAISENAGYLLVGSGSVVRLYVNGDFSEAIPGSRVGWAVVFISADLAVAAVLAKYITISKARRLGVVEVASVPALAAASIIGGYLYFGDPWSAVLVCGAGSCVGCLSYLLVGRGGFLSVGVPSGFIASLLGGVSSSLVTWVAGSEKNVVQLAILGLLNGGVGLLAAIIGATLGYAIVRFLGKR